ncbi:MAG: GFA family protein, partial [Limnobacter sp.]|nr:GFA family protein [Limnobacter sp.]
ACMFTAQCSCRQLRLKFSRSPFAQLVCHCNDCRKVSQAPFTEVVFFRPEADCVAGEASATEMQGSSGLSKTYMQCAHCNEFVFATVDALKGMVGIVANRIEAPFEFKPMAHVWTSQKQQDVHIDPKAVQFEQAPVFPRA